MATALLLGAGVTAIAAVHAEEAVLVPGATVFKPINPLYPVLAKTYPVIGAHFHDDDDAQVVGYSQNALNSDRAIANGVDNTIGVVKQAGGDVVLIGESMGAMVVSRVAAQLLDDPAAPKNIRFVVIASPEAGIGEYFKVVTFIPILNYHVSRIPQTGYPTAVVIGEYDGWSDPPDRPWNLAATANALLGIAFVHGPPIAAADPHAVPSENVTTVGSVTTYLVPTGELPLTQPLRLIGVPDRVVDQIDRVLRPVIDAAYVRHDAPGDTRPYIADGEIRRGSPSSSRADELVSPPANRDAQAGRVGGAAGPLERKAVERPPATAERRAPRAAGQAEAKAKREPARAERPAARAERPAARAERPAARADKHTAHSQRRAGDG